MKLIFLLLLFIILICFFKKQNDNFTINIGHHIKFMKEDKFSNTLSQKDINLVRKIEKAYENPNTYFTKINQIGLPYLRNPKRTNKFEKEINYQKHRTVNNLLPYKHEYF